MFIPFTKMHGLGNDYLIIDERDRSLLTEQEKPTFARHVCRRGFAVGSDGILFLTVPDQADVQMRIFNADGSEAESCGNGLRCTAYYHHGLQKPGESQLTINLPLAGTMDAEVDYEQPPSAHVRLILDNAGRYQEQRTLKLEHSTLHYHYVDAGNPHAVFFLDENEQLPDSPEDLALSELGAEIQAHSDFEDTGGVNAEFVVDNESGQSMRMRVHERGVGETNSCGTGCIGVARACAETERAEGWVEVEQPGGTLRIETHKGYLEGPATLSYRGELYWEG